MNNNNVPAFLKSFLALLTGLVLSGCNLTIHTTGQGTVEFNSADYQACANQFANCSAWPTGAEVTLNPQPAEGYYFHGWEGDCAGQGACTVTMSRHRQVRAVFLANEGLVPAPEFKPETDHFFSAPWPNDAYSLNADGAVDLREFPFQKGTRWEKALKRLAKETHGFSTNGGVIFQLALGYPLPEIYLPTYQARIINTDPDSDNYGQSIPAEISFYEDPEPVIENSMLLVVTPETGHPLDPATSYTVALYNSALDSAPADLMVALDGDYSPATNISAALFQELKQQKQALKALDEREPLAFTRLTTQDPKIIDRAIGKTLNTFSGEDILNSVESVERIESCFSELYTENYLLKVRFPVFQQGKRPYFLSGGGIVTENGAAVIQDYETLELLLQVPCEAPPPQGFPVKVHATETLQDWSDAIFDGEVGNHRVIQLVLSAPESRSRESDLINKLDDFLTDFDVDSWAIRVLLGIITDFNVLNLESARYSHMQYGAELFYTQKLALLLEQIVPHNDRLVMAPEQRILSGDSAGGIALVHARAMGAEADMIVSTLAPRPSYIHISSIVSFMRDIDFPESFVRFLSRLTGLHVTENRNQPLSHIVQTVMEPMDTLNYLDELNAPELLYVLADYDDSLHGGEAGYSIAAGLQRTLDIIPLLDAPHTYYYSLAPFVDFSNAMTFEGFGHSNGRHFLGVYEWDAMEGDRLYETGLYRGTRCYGFDIFRKGRPFDGGDNFAPFMPWVDPQFCRPAQEYR